MTRDLNFFKITPIQLLLSVWNFVTFSIYPKDTFWKKIRSMTLLLHMMTSSRKMTVQILRSNPCWSRKHEMPIKSCLSKIFTWNFHTMLVMIWVIHCKRKILFYLRSSLFFYCSLLFSNNGTIGRQLKDEIVFICYW